MITWIDAVYDRTQADVDLLNTLNEKGYRSMSGDEIKMYCAGMKGAFNLSDMARIENNVQLLSNVLELNLTTYYGKLPVRPTEKYFANLLKNVEIIRGAYSIHAGTPKTPAAPVNSFCKVNDIEHILNDVYEIIMDNFNYYAGEDLFAGEETALLL